MQDRVDLDELEKLLGAATPEPWTASDRTSHLPGGFEPDCVVDSRGYTVADATGDDDDLVWANNILIAELRNRAPAMIAELRELREALEWYRDCPWGWDGEDRPYIGYGDGDSSHRDHPDFREKDGGNIARVALDATKKRGA